MSAPTQVAAAQGVRWDLSSLFASIEDPKIKTLWEKADAEADAFVAAYKGKIESAALSAQELSEAIKQYEHISSEASKPVHFGNLLFAADTSDEKIAAFMQDQTEKASALRVKLMFFGLELLKAPDDFIKNALKDSALSNYVHFVKVARAYKPYILSEPEEVILEEAANIGSRAWVRLHDEVTSALKCPFIDPATGEKSELSLEATVDKLYDSDRAVRQAAADAMTSGLESIEKVIAFTYNTLLADKRMDDRLRKHEYAEQSRHMANELDKETVDIVMRLCRERGDLVERYYKVKASILGLQELTHIDRYAPLFEAKQQVGYEEARRIVTKAFGEFSLPLAERAEEFFAKNWIDAEPRDGKTGGAFCNYNTPDLHPVVLMSYLGKMGDVMTLAHELGHGAHASFSRIQTELNYHGTLPLAELASIFGEMLVFDSLVKNAEPKDKLALYAKQIEGIFASVHRQSAMFRYEQRCHTERREKGELSRERFRDIWQEEMQSMFGGGLTLGEQHKCWWLYVGHFFFAPFYVYAYSFGELLTLSIYQMAKKSGPDFAEKYVEVLKLGGSKTPYELMLILDVDLRSEQFWKGGFQAIDDMVSEFERIWKADS